jgi:hypothetical protein
MLIHLSWGGASLAQQFESTPLALKKRYFYLDKLLSKCVPLSKSVYFKAELLSGHAPLSVRSEPMRFTSQP